MSHATHQNKSHPDMRLRENREESTNNEHEHLKINGSPDHRYKENRENHQQNSGKHDEDDSSNLADIPTKKDGTADMRYNESKEAVSSGVISKEDVVEDALNDEDDHQKNDGTKEKRSKGNQQDDEE